jgi:hypothetical protein
VDIYAGSVATPLVSAATTGIVTIGPSTGSNVIQQIYGGIVGRPITTNTWPVGFNYYVNSGIAARIDNARTGGAILLNGNTDNTTAVIQFRANQFNDSTTTASDTVGSMDANGAWTLGPDAGGVTHLIIGRNSSTAETLMMKSAATGTRMEHRVVLDRTGVNTIWDSATESGDAGFIWQTGNVNTRGSISSTGTWTITGAAKPFIVNSTGNVRSQYVRDNTTASAANLVVDSNGDFFKSTSSLRYKKDVDYNGVDGSIAYRLKPVSFKSKRDDSAHLGFIAEDVAEQEPRLVTYEPDENGVQRPEAVEYAIVTAVLTKALQDLKTDFDAYKAAHP